MLSRGVESLLLTQTERYEIEGRACALLLQANECGSSDLRNPAALGSLSLPIVLATPTPVVSHAPTSTRKDDRRRSVSSRAATSASQPTRKNPIEQPLEPAPVAMLLRVAQHGVAEALRVAADPERGVLYTLKNRWPRLYKHLRNICSRADLADVVRRKRGGHPPETTLQHVIDEEWLTHGFVGALPRDTLLWVWDQFALQGWQLASELAACCFYLIRREVRRLDRDANAAATELRVAMCVQLREEAQLEQLQALLAPSSAKAREGVGVQRLQPQVMLQMPLAS